MKDAANNSSITEYRMTVHLFGATSSPGCASFALKRTADGQESQFGPDPANFIRTDFYVDYGLKSVPTANEAMELIHQTRAMCHKGGL